MPNLLQKAIYNLSSAAPLCVAFGFVWWTEYHTWMVPVICAIAFFLLVFSLEISFAYCKKNLPPIKIRANEFAPHDAWIVAFVVSYLLPFASMALEDFNLSLSGTIAMAIILLAPFVNSAIPNPLLFLRGYHFYQVKTEHGASDFVLISKRKIRNVKEIRTVQRICEFLLLDVEAIDV